MADVQNIAQSKADIEQIKDVRYFKVFFNKSI